MHWQILVDFSIMGGFIRLIAGSFSSRRFADYKFFETSVAGDTHPELTSMMQLQGSSQPSSKAFTAGATAGSDLSIKTYVPVSGPLVRPRPAPRQALRAVNLAQARVTSAAFISVAAENPALVPPPRVPAPRFHPAGESVLSI